MAVVVDAEIIAKASAFLMSVRTELFLFLVAVAAYFLLLNNAAPRRSTKSKKSVYDKHVDFQTEGHADTDPDKLDDLEHVEASFAIAHGKGDHRQVVRCWHAMKRFDRAPCVSLASVVESMQRIKKEHSYILRELRAFLQKHRVLCNMRTINDVMASLGRRLDADFANKVLELLPELGLKADQSTYEALLAMSFTARNFPEVARHVANMERDHVPRSLRCILIIIKCALKSNNFEEAKKHFKEMKNVWTDGGNGHLATPSHAPQQIVTQIVDLACKEHQLKEFLPELHGAPLTDDTLNCMLVECARQKDTELAKQVEELCRQRGTRLSQTTYGLLMKAMSHNVAKLNELFEEVLASGAELSSDFALGVITICSQSNHVALVGRLYGVLRSKPMALLAAFVRFYADHDQFERVCEIYETDMVLHMGDRCSSMVDARVERLIMNAALRCGRSDLAKNFLDNSPSDIARHITMIRNCASSNDLAAAFKVFQSLQQSGVELNSVVYNTVLDACVECRDLAAAKVWMLKMKQASMTDVVSYNTLIKAHLHNANYDEARSLMQEMREQGLQPNRVTYNELINSMVSQGKVNRTNVWAVVREMKAAGFKPNQVTCSILLKNLDARSNEVDIRECMDLISNMEEPMDEVLLSSVVEACVRIGKPDLLASKLKQLQGPSGVGTVTGSHTFGSLIKAYGCAKDVDGVWRCWREMRSRHIKPTSITLGCMIEAVVSNGDTEGAYELIHQVQEDEQCQNALNSVIYCSVLKGFTREKKIERVWEVYHEMSAHNVELSIVTYNTLIDACARCGRMDYVPDIMLDMRKMGVRPNVITYSTMLKGHCQMGDIKMGFSILDQMKSDPKLKPDEIMYNSLLDGCAQHNLVDDGVRLLDQMQEAGVVPSNFTLSIVVKLMSRARRLDSAFQLVEELCGKYRIHMNVHVYTNLIQACVSNRSLMRGMNTLEEMLKFKISPDTRTYAILIRASITQGLAEQAVGLLRGALGLQGAAPHFLSQPIAKCHNLDPAVVNEALLSLIDKGHGQDLAAPLLGDLRLEKPHMRFDPAIGRRIVGDSGKDISERCRDSAPTYSRKGKGKGNAGGGSLVRA